MRAALELFVYLDPDVAPDEQVALAAVIPEGVTVARIGTEDLPADWRRYPAPRRLQDLGTGWAREAKTVALSVPSAVIPQERNVFINPKHPELARIRFGEPTPFAFDPRMWKR